jgi:uncharacterized protein YidB (DUF937 family)
VIDNLTPQGQLPQNNNLLQQGLAALLGGGKDSRG